MAVLRLEGIVGGLVVGDDYAGFGKEGKFGL